MSHTVLGILYREGWRLNFRILVQEFVKGVILLADEINWGVLDAVRMRGRESAEVVKVYQLGVSMIRRQVEVCQEVRAQDSGLDIRDDKVISEGAFADGDGAGYVAETRDVRAICGHQFDAICSLTALLGSRRDEGDEGASVDQPALIPLGIYHVK